MGKDILMKMIGFFVNRFVQDSSAEVEDGLTSTKEMQELCRSAVSESCVLLENDGMLPLQNEQVALFGRTQYNSFFTGYGSGGDVKAPYKVNIVDGFKRNGIKIDEKIDSIYAEWTKKNVPYDGFWGFWPFSYPEMPISEKEIEEASKRNEKAFVVIGRAAGEDRENKRKKGSWYLSKEEETLLKNVSKYFKKVCVLLNVGSIMDMSWVKKYHVNAVLYVWLGGQELGNGVADVLTGTVSPCGKLPDTVAPLTSYPTDENFGKLKISHYVEDCFVGYRYFESFDTSSVLYPFGFGLSYTKFSIKGQKVAETDDRITLSVSVKNVGEKKGKCVVQIYGKAPSGKLGKVSRMLLAFQKTKTLSENEEETLTITIEKSAFASFDDKNAIKNQSYILEEGTYRIYLGEDVRSAKEVATFEEKETKILKTVEEICPPQKNLFRMTEKDGKLNYEQVPLGTRNLKERILKNLPQTLPAVRETHTFDEVLSGKITAETFVSSLSDKELEHLVRGGDHGMYDPVGTSGNAGVVGGTIESLRKKGVPVLSTTDGMSGVRLQAHCSLIPIATALSASFNAELVEKIGREVGKEMVDRKSDILLAPNVNLHRHPLGGRNFEYYSEDPILSGKLASAFIRGVQSQNVSATLKHFACNNQETGRHVNDSIVSTKALREVYLKAFEICVKESDPDFVMMSYNKLNGVLNCYQYDLATTLLRNEWGYTGCVMTDWWMDYGRSPDFDIDLQAYRVRAQIDLFMPGSAKFGKYKNKSDESLLRALKKGTLTRGEVERSALNVIRLCIKRKGKKYEKN